MQTVLLAKGEMEQDYLVRVCGIPPQRVEIGAPILPERILESGRDKGKKPFIVFFSEAYEMTGGRARDFYQGHSSFAGRSGNVGGPRINYQTTSFREPFGSEPDHRSAFCGPSRNE